MGEPNYINLLYILNYEMYAYIYVFGLFLGTEQIPGQARDGTVVGQARDGTVVDQARDGTVCGKT